MNATSTTGVPRIVIVGSGSLARSVCYSMAAIFRLPVAVSVLARSASALAELTYVANTRARLSRSGATFHMVVVDLCCAGQLDEVLAHIGPAIVVHCASLQSPWERLTAPSPWTELVTRAGFGVTLPLHAALAVDLARSITRAGLDVALVNACYPDAVNPVLHALGLPLLCGIGNVALLAASLQTALRLEDQRSLQVLAHHVHLHEPACADEEAMAWRGGEALADVSAMLAPLRAAARPELNAITGHAAALLLEDLLRGEEVFTSLPGPLGMPGGYPVRLQDGRISLNLPAELTVASAVAWNQRAALRDGVQVSASAVRFSEAAERELRRHVPGIAAGFSVADLREVCDLLLELRTHQRRGKGH